MHSQIIHFASQICSDDTITKFFGGKDIFITGGSGFMGKVLIEKLLRTCPEIGNIYILLRPKYNQNLEERLSVITNNILFDKLRDSKPEAFNKIIPIEGDAKELNLGISENDRKLLNNVSVVYHVAATVRFDETLADSILMNTRGTREVCKLVLSLAKIDVFLHVSTAYCQHDKKIVEEKLYPANYDWHKLIEIIEKTDQYKMKIISPTLMNGYPNTYTYSKALAEAVIIDMCQGKVHTVIIRPTIVVAIQRDPIPGWVDNKNGPVGLVAATAKGVLRSTYVNFNATLDFIPVDVAINTFLQATWIQKYLHKEHVSVYNCSSQGIVEVSSRTMQEIGAQVQERVTPAVLWYPSFYATDNKFLHLCNIYLFHLIPAIIVDLILKCFKNPPKLLKLQRKIYLAMNSLEYFVRNKWVFRNDKFIELNDYLHEDDKDMFHVDIRNVDVLEFFTTAARVGFKIILNEDLSDVKKNNRNMKRMGYVHHFLKYAFIIFFMIFAMNNIVGPLAERFLDYLTSL